MARRRPRADGAPRAPGIAGLFGTGTRLLADALGRNCALPGGAVPGQVPWGKHNPVGWRDDYDDYPAREGRRGGRRRRDDNASDPRALDASRVLPVVTVQDPLVWMRSMCGSAYAWGWLRRRGGRECHPRLVPAGEGNDDDAADGGGGGVEIAFRQDRRVAYDSLVAMWNE